MTAHELSKGSGPGDAVIITVSVYTQVCVLADESSEMHELREPYRHPVSDFLKNMVLCLGDIFEACTFKLSSTVVMTEGHTSGVVGMLEHAPGKGRTVISISGGKASDLEEMLTWARVRESGHKRILEAQTQKERMLKETERVDRTTHAGITDALGRAFDTAVAVESRTNKRNAAEVAVCDVATRETAAALATSAAKRARLETTKDKIEDKAKGAAVPATPAVGALATVATVSASVTECLFCLKTIDFTLGRIALVP